MKQVTVISINQYGEEEWKENITAKTKAAARAKATRWINNNLFASDYEFVTKHRQELDRELWIVHS